MPVARSLDAVGNGVWAYTQLPGSWGWSNAGLIADGDESLLVDTLFDAKTTASMLEAMRKATRAAERIHTVVNTHGNGDHCYGNTLVADAEILATRGCVEDLAESPPRRNALLLGAGRVGLGLGVVGRGLARSLRAVGIPQLETLLDAASLAVPLFEAFDFPFASAPLPNRTFDGRCELTVGQKRVELVEAGPAHTRGDAYVYLPDDRVVFTGDLVFKNAHPIAWQGPVSRWIEACRAIAALDVETVVPGHGPLTDKSGLHETIAYFEHLTAEARKRYDAGVDAEEAARDIAVDAFRDWIDAERVYVNVRRLYKDFAGDHAAPDVLGLFAGMARFKRDVT